VKRPRRSLLDDLGALVELAEEVVEAVSPPEPAPAPEGALDLSTRYPDALVMVEAAPGRWVFPRH